MLFTFPSRYSFAIGLSGVFSLAGWARLIHAGLHVSRATQGTDRVRHASRKGLSPSMAGLSRPFRSLVSVPCLRPTTPRRPEPPGFGLRRVRSPLLAVSLLFSLPPGTKMFQFPGFAPRTARCRNRFRRVAPFGNLRLNGYLPLAAAYRSLSRPSSAPDAKSFSLRSL